MKTCCALVLVLLGIVVTEAAQSDNPDPNPTKCCPLSKKKNCTFDKYIDTKFKRTATPFLTWSVNSIKECFQLCKHVVSGCKAINYKENDAENNCQFMNTLQNPDDKSVMRDRDYKSAIVNPSCDDLCTNRTMILDWHRPKNDIQTIENVTDPAECCNLCLNHEDCIAYDYNYNSDNCFLKNVIKKAQEAPGLVLTGLSCPLAEMECTCK